MSGSLTETSCSNLKHIKKQKKRDRHTKISTYNCVKDNINTKEIKTLPPQAIQKIKTLIERCN
jgi:hypothetical protein